MKPKRPTLRYNVIKIGNVKDKQATLKAARMKQVTYKGFLRSNLTRREWQEIFKVLHERNLQPKIIYPARLLRIEGNIKNSPKHKLKEFITTKPGLQEILKGLLYAEKL